MNFRSMALASVAGTLIYYAFGAIGGVFFANVYSHYADVFRPRDAIMGYLPYGFAGTLVAMFIAVAIYAWGYKRGGIGVGIRFGALLGFFLIFACVLHDYVIINVGQDVGLVEALGQLAGWALAGAAIGLIYRPSVTPGP